jgi:diguanylate cyclase (GGDEF)-like protein
VTWVTKTAPGERFGNADQDSVIDLATELDNLENHEGHDIDAILARAILAAEAAARAGEPVLVRRAELVQADMRQRHGDAGEAARTFLETYRWAEEHDCRPLLARCHFHLTLTYHYLGDQAASFEHAVSSVELLEVGAPDGLRIIYLIRLANALAEMGSIEASRLRYRQAEDLAVRIGDLRRQMLVLNNLAYTELEAGDVGQATAVLERMYATAGALNRELLVVERDTVANILISLDRLAEAEQILEAIHDAPGWFEVHDFADAALTLAGVQRRLGHLDRAQVSLDRCHQICADHALTGLAVRAKAEQAELHAANDDYRAAFEEYKRFNAASEEMRSRQQEARARTRQAMFETAEAREDAERYREQARRDALTGIHNRRHVDERLPQLIAQSARAGLPLTVALLDLDHFKRINDTLSHETGDRVLVVVAGLLQSYIETVPGDGLAGRLGGEEFLLVLPGVTAGEAVAMLDGLREAVAGYSWRDITGDLPVTVSVGLATSNGTQDDVTQAALVADADRALYAAKHSGRNRVMAAAPVG